MARQRKVIRKIDDPRVEKLPTWAQEMFVDLQRERDSAINLLREFTDRQTPSPMWVEEWASLEESGGPTTFLHYLQARRVCIDFEGVSADILLRPGEGIDIHYHQSGRYTGDVYLTPRSYQSILLHKEPR